jgi:CDGSH-type Zn-finger protein
MGNTEDKTKPKIRPSIEASKDGPYLVIDLEILENSKGECISVKPFMALCRCGQSSNKPFCDGTHKVVGFSGEKSEDRVPDKMDDYKGTKIIIHDNRGVCSHRGHCTDKLPHVFRMRHRPWIIPDEESPEEEASVIKMCPSGALSYSKDGVLYKDLDKEFRIAISKDGPYDVEGGIVFLEQNGNSPESEEHFTLCRCGGSKNKPFCDGNHWYIKFKDEKN